MALSRELPSSLNLKSILLILRPCPKRPQGILKSKRRPNRNQKVTTRMKTRTVWQKRPFWYAFKIQVEIYRQLSFIFQAKLEKIRKRKQLKDKRPKKKMKKEEKPFFTSGEIIDLTWSLVLFRRPSWVSFCRYFFALHCHICFLCWYLLPLLISWWWYTEDSPPSGTPLN